MCQRAWNVAILMAPFAPAPSCLSTLSRGIVSALILAVCIDTAICIAYINPTSPSELVNNLHTSHRLPVLVTDDLLLL